MKLSFMRSPNASWNVTEHLLYLIVIEDWIRRFEQIPNKLSMFARCLHIIVCAHYSHGAAFSVYAGPQLSFVVMTALLCSVMLGLPFISVNT